jgi:hypothetical protein
VSLDAQQFGGFSRIIVPVDHLNTSSIPSIGGYFAGYQFGRNRVFGWGEGC